MGVFDDSSGMCAEPDWSALKDVRTALQQLVFRVHHLLLPHRVVTDMFSITTTSLGWVTAKYGSAVTIMPKACSSVVTFSFASSLAVKHDFAQVLARPSGEMAQSCT